MKMCVPTTGEKGLDDIIGEHFGRVPTYTIVDSETNDVTIIPNTSEHRGGTGYPPELMQKNGVDVLLCQGLGRKALTMFEQYGIDVYIGATGRVKDAMKAFKQGNLKKATDQDACGRHAFRNHHQHRHQD